MVRSPLVERGCGCRFGDNYLFRGGQVNRVNVVWVSSEAPPKECTRCGFFDCTCDETPRGVVVADAVEAALKGGSSYALALALRDFVAYSVVQHSAAMGRPVSEAVAQAIGGNAAMPLADWMRR